MKIYYDFHIHSALSPCGDKDMTPNNIVNMAYIKGLNAISVTDHNSMLNVEPIMKLGKKRDILVIPGIEVTTKEEVHVLCYFNNLKLGEEFANIIFSSIPDIKNVKEIFGEQLIFDENDNILGEENKLLINSTKYSINEVSRLVEELNGVLIPSHIDKRTNSLVSVLGYVPIDLNIKTVELSSKNNEDLYDKKYSITEIRKIFNSDAHYLTDISESVNFLTCDVLEIKSIFDIFR